MGNTISVGDDNIALVAGNMTNVNLVGGSIANVNNVGNSIANVNTVASNLSGVNAFAARYRTDNTGNNPSSNNDAGDLFYNQQSGKLLVYNGVTSAWEETQSVGNFFINTIGSFSGTGGNSATFNNSAYKFTLSNAGQFAQQMLVSINGVIQKPNSGTGQPSEGFALDGANIVFSDPPPSGADYFIVTIGASVSIGTPSDNTVTSAKIVNGTIVNDDINASAAIALTKLATSGTPNNTNFLRGDGAWTTVVTDLVNDTSPQLGGDLDVNSNDILLGDNGELKVGAGTDLRIYHYSNNNWINTVNGNLNFARSGTTKFGMDGSNGDLFHVDGNKAYYGDSADFEIYHQSNENWFKANNGVTNFLLDNWIQFKNKADNETLFRAQPNGAFEAYHDNVLALQTKVNQGNTGAGVILQNPTGTGNRIVDIKHPSGDYAFLAFEDQNTTDNSIVRLGAYGNTMRFYGGGNFAAVIDANGHFLPGSNNTFDLGASGTRWRNIYTNDLNLSNEGGANDVDGTWGSYTIQEGAEDLFLINKRSGKKYKFNLTEVG